MKIAFDPVKDSVNRVKHGISLALAEILFAERYVTVTDDRFDYGERREIALGSYAAVCLRVSLSIERTSDG